MFVPFREAERAPGGVKWVKDRLWLRQFNSEQFSPACFVVFCLFVCSAQHGSLIINSLCGVNYTHLSLQWHLYHTMVMIVTTSEEKRSSSNRNDACCRKGGSSWQPFINCTDVLQMWRCNNWTVVHTKAYRDYCLLASIIRQCITLYNVVSHLHTQWRHMLLSLINVVQSYITLLPIWSSTVLHTRTNCVTHHSWVVLPGAYINNTQTLPPTTHTVTLNMKETRSSASHFQHQISKESTNSTISRYTQVFCLKHSKMHLAISCKSRKTVGYDIKSYKW